MPQGGCLKVLALKALGLPARPGVLSLRTWQPDAMAEEHCSEDLPEAMETLPIIEEPQPVGLVSEVADVCPCAVCTCSYEACG